jgi:hypothetical protein
MLTQSQERSTIAKPLDPARLRESVKQEAGQFSKTQNLLCEFVEELMRRVEALEAENAGLKS